MHTWYCYGKEMHSVALRSIEKLRMYLSVLKQYRYKIGQVILFHMKDTLEKG